MTRGLIRSDQAGGRCTRTGGGFAQRTEKDRRVGELVFSLVLEMRSLLELLFFFLFIFLCLKLFFYSLALRWTSSTPFFRGACPWSSATWAACAGSKTLEFDSWRVLSLSLHSTRLRALIYLQDVCSRIRREFWTQCMAPLYFVLFFFSFLLFLYFSLVSFFFVSFC